MLGNSNQEYVVAKVLTKQEEPNEDCKNRASQQMFGPSYFVMARTVDLNPNPNLHSIVLYMFRCCFWYSGVPDKRGALITV